MIQPLSIGDVTGPHRVHEAIRQGARPLKVLATSVKFATPPPISSTWQGRNYGSPRKSIANHVFRLFHLNPWKMENVPLVFFLGKGIYAIVVEKRWEVDENRSFGRSKSGDTPVWLALSHLSPIKIEIQPSKIGKKWSSPTNLWTYQSKWWHLNTGEATHETSNSQLECK